MIKYIVLSVLYLFMLQSPAEASEPYQGEIIDSFGALDIRMKDWDVIISTMEKAGVSKIVLTVKGAKARKAHREFAEQYYETFPLADLHGRDLANVYGSVQGSWRFLQHFDGKFIFIDERNVCRGM